MTATEKNTKQNGAKDGLNPNKKVVRCYNYDSLVEATATSNRMAAVVDTKRASTTIFRR